VNSLPLEAGWHKKLRQFEAAGDTGTADRL
jgi:hypothetical protein